MDEHSMMGLQDWAWVKYRNEELQILYEKIKIQ
jgi:hypothetical protein